MTNDKAAREIERLRAALKTISEMPKKTLEEWGEEPVDGSHDSGMIFGMECSAQEADTALCATHTDQEG